MCKSLFEARDQLLQLLPFIFPIISLRGKWSLIFFLNLHEIQLLKISILRPLQRGSIRIPSTQGKPTPAKCSCPGWWCQLTKQPGHQPWAQTEATLPLPQIHGGEVTPKEGGDSQGYGATNTDHGVIWRWPSIPSHLRVHAFLRSQSYNFTGNYIS